MMRFVLVVIASPQASARAWLGGLGLGLLVVAVIVLRVKRPEWPRPFRAPGYPYLPLLYAAAGLALIAILVAGNPRTTWPGYAIVMTGVPVYFLWKRRR